MFITVNFNKNIFLIINQYLTHLLSNLKESRHFFLNYLVTIVDKIQLNLTFLFKYFTLKYCKILCGVNNKNSKEDYNF